ncbi:MAG: sigma-70 family RNA polymerase sigma factor [Oscillospiraceae bacterium]|nr:sigma-70 family RNA polymerase sigma factor [Oscillospiraceae bacterium]
MRIFREDFYDESDYIDFYDNSDDDKEKQPAGESDELELLEYDDWMEAEDDESTEESWVDEAVSEPEVAPEDIQPDPDEPAPLDTSAERSGKLLRREMKAEALRRMEESARTRKDFEKVLAAWDKREDSADRTIRNHLQFRGDVPLEYGVTDIIGAKVFPACLGLPTERQISRGNFLDVLAHCPYEMHDLSGKGYICEAVDRLTESHRELLYFMGIQGFSPQQMALIRGQTDRNIRKVRDTMLRKVQKHMYMRLTEWMDYGYQPTHREEAFIARYEAEMEGNHDEAV